MTKNEKKLLIVAGVGVVAYLLLKKNDGNVNINNGGLNSGSTDESILYESPVVIAPPDLSGGVSLDYAASAGKDYLIKTANGDAGLINAYATMSAEQLRDFQTFIAEFVVQGRILKMFQAGTGGSLYPAIKSIMEKYPVLKIKYGNLIS